MDIPNIFRVVGDNNCHKLELVINYLKNTHVISLNDYINLTDEYNQNALWYATSCEMVQLLLDNGININQVDHNGKNAIWESSIDIIKLLIDNRININQLCSWGHNALHSTKINYTKFELLVNNGIDVNSISTYSPFFPLTVISTALWYIYKFSETEQLKAIKLLLEHGYNINIDLLRISISNCAFRVYPIFDKSLLYQYPQLQTFKDKFLIIDDPIVNDPTSYKPFCSSTYCYDELYRKLRKYFDVSTDDEVDLIMGEL